MGGRTEAAFVGRARELGELERVLEEARGGRGAIVLIVGEPGIGKTRLASEFAERARDTGFAVLIGRAIDLVGTELPYQPFVEALLPLGGRRRGRHAGSGLTAARFRGDACAAQRARSGRARVARARRPALGG